MKRDLTQFEGIRTKCPTWGFMIRKTLVQPVKPGPGLQASASQEQLAGFTELCGPGASAVRAVGCQRNGAKTWV